MKGVRLILVIAGCLLIYKPAYASRYNAGLPQRSSGTSTGSGSDRSSEADQAATATRSKVQREATATPDERLSNRPISKNKRHTHKVGASLPKTNRPKQVQQSRPRSTSQSLANVHQPSLTKPTGGAVRKVNTHIPSIRPASGSAVDGRNFRPGHNTATGPATIGGPDKVRKNTEALNGTGIPHRH